MWLTGRWEGQRKKDDHVSDAWPGGLEWTLHLIDRAAEHRKYVMKPHANTHADKPQYYKQVAIQLADGVKGLLHVNLVNGITCFGVFRSGAFDHRNSRPCDMHACHTSACWSVQS
jgi:hypothetical protein